MARRRRARLSHWLLQGHDEPLPESHWGPPASPSHVTVTVAIYHNGPFAGWAVLARAGQRRGRPAVPVAAMLLVG